MSTRRGPTRRGIGALASSRPVDWGWPLQLAALGGAAVIGLALVLLPARALARHAETALRRAAAAYFLLVGAGFMFSGSMAVQHLVLPFGHLVHAFRDPRRLPVRRPRPCAVPRPPLAGAV